MTNIYQFLNNITLPHGSVVIECGGHVGSDTKKLAALFPNNIIHTIEANTFMYDKYLKPLEQSVPNVKVYCAGLSDVTGVRTFYIDTDPRGNAGASSFLRANSTGPLRHLFSCEKPVETPCFTFQDFLTQNDIVHVGFLWLDIEQHEYEVLKAIPSDVFQNIDYIYLEVNYQEFRHQGKNAKAIEELLAPHYIQIASWPQGASNYTWQANVLYRRLDIDAKE